MSDAAGDESVELNVPKRHTDGGFGQDWFVVRAAGEPVVINDAGEGSVDVYTIAGTTKNPRAIANADAVMWDGIVGLTNYEDGLVSIQHRYAGIRGHLPVDEWLDESVPVLELTELVDIKATGGRVEFTCSDCGEHIERKRHQMDIPGMTPTRCTSCTFQRMGARR